jgi:Tol biopolymer transport system component
VQRWEKREGMPVHRHLHDKQGSVYAFRSELDAWTTRRAQAASSTPEEAAGPGPGDEPTAPPAAPSIPAAAPDVRRSRRRAVAAAAALAVVLAAALAWWRMGDRGAGGSPLDGARYVPVTDFEGAEQAAAISRDGRFVAFLSDRDGRMDVWVTQVGTGQFYNLTRGRVRDLVNPDVRTLGFSPDASLVTFWARGVAGAAGDEIGTWAIPILGGDPRPYLEGAAEYDWSPDGLRVVFHTPAPGDPTFLADVSRRPAAPAIFTAPPGQHAHYPSWSPDGAFVYFAQGTVPDALDLYRMASDGGHVERLTHHEAAVSHPVLLDARTLLYLVGEQDGDAARLHVLDLERRTARPIGTGVERYYSLGASADGRRVVATLADTKGTLWRLDLGGDRPAGLPQATAVALPTGRARAPRLGPGYTLYVAAKGPGQGIWKLVDRVATELWSGDDARIVGGPAIAPDGNRVAFAVEQQGATRVYLVNADGTGARVVHRTLEVRGAPTWTPDGQALATAALVDGTTRLVRLTPDGATTPLATGVALDPAWAPDGAFVAYSGPDIGTRVGLAAVTADGSPHPVPEVALTRGGRRLRFLRGGHTAVILRGDMRHKDLWSVDLDTGVEQQLTALPPDFVVRDFDLSPDGRAAIVERVQEHADVVIIERPPGR